VNYWILFAVALAGILFGDAIGMYSERRAWKARGAGNDIGSPHYCDGTLYYVIRSQVFNDRCIVKVP
jgi:hypothetical protein